MSDYKGGYKTDVARADMIQFERIKYEQHLKLYDLIDLQGRISRGEPNPIDRRYGGEGYAYYYPRSIGAMPDLGRCRVSLEGHWKFEWEDVNIG